MRKVQKKAKLFFIAVIIVAVAVYGFVQMNKPVEIKTATIKKQSLIRSFKESGKIKSNDEITVTPK